MCEKLRSIFRRKTNAEPPVNQACARRLEQSGAPGEPRRIWRAAMRQRQSAREQRGPLRQPQVTKVRWSWGRVGYERAERPSEKNSGSRGRRDSQCPSEPSGHRCRRRGEPREVDITRWRGDNRLIGGHQGEGGHVVAHQQAGGETAVLRDEKITAVKSTEAARRAALFHAMQACSASAPVCAAYRMRNSPVKVPGRNRSLAFSLVGVPWWSL